MKKKIVVLGAGIAGCIAYHAFRAENPLIIEAKPQKDTIPTHSALMRLRDPEVARFIGASCKEIEIEKGIYYNGEFVEPNILLNNMYSLKLYDEIGKRSILKPGSSKRYILDNGFPAPGNIMWDSKVKRIKKGIIILEDDTRIPYDYCISTLPMFTTRNLIKYNPAGIDLKFDSKRIYVKRYELNATSCVHQTIYYPDPYTPLYRATLQGKLIIAESSREMLGYDTELILESFGLFDCKIRLLSEDTLMLGKIKTLEEHARLQYILWLTDNMNLFSFGRFAIWKPIRTDHLIGDIEKIKRIAIAKDVESSYRRRLEK
jgi:hypothetical protein